MPKVAEMTLWRRRLFAGMERLSAGELGKKYDLRPCLARNWMRDRLSGQNITKRVNSYYYYTAINGKGKDKGTTPAMLWVYGVLDMFEGDAPTADITAKYQIKENTIERWRERWREGDDIKNLLRMYYYRRFRAHKKRKREFCRETDSESMRAVVSGQKCAMCGVWFEREHERPVACVDCRRRRDFRPRMRRYGRTMEVVEAWHGEMRV